MVRKLFVNNLYFTVLFGDANSKEMATLRLKLSLSLFEFFKFTN